jgi:hypothetical protein
VLALRARLAWAHGWLSDPTLAGVFQTLAGASFVVNCDPGLVMRCVYGVKLQHPHLDSGTIRRPANVSAGGVSRIGFWGGPVATPDPSCND